MSRYNVQPIDFSGLQNDFARGARRQSERRGFRHVLTQKGAGSAAAGFAAADSGRRVVSRGGRRYRESARSGKPIIWGMGGHVIKCGLAPVLIDLMERGFATAFAMNGSASIHDFEIALAGHTSEDVEAVLPDGRFGAAEETGREMNQAIAGGARDGIGLGEALGRALENGAARALTSLLAAAYAALGRR